MNTSSQLGAIEIDFETDVVSDPESWDYGKTIFTVFINIIFGITNCYIPHFLKITV